MKKLSVTAIVPVYNAANCIQDCLEALLAQSFDRPLEIIIADDGSTDQTATIVGEYRARGVQLLSLAHQGAGPARNAGIAAATGDLLLFTDADCAPDCHWASSFVKAFEAEPNLAGAKGIYLSNQKAVIARFVQAEYADRYRRMAQAHAIDFVDTYAAAYRHTVLQSENFDPRYPGAIVEDAELAYRLAERGLYLKFIPEAIVYHRHVSTIQKYFRRKFRIGFWRVAVYKQHPEKLRGDSHTPQVAKLQMALVTYLLIALLNGVWFKLRGKPGLARRIWQTSLIASVSFIFSTLPFSWRSWQDDKTVALISPFMLLIRAVALASGAIIGIFRLIFLPKLPFQ